MWFQFFDEKAAAISAEVANLTVNQQESKCKQIGGTTKYVIRAKLVPKLWNHCLV